MAKEFDINRFLKKSDDEEPGSDAERENFLKSHEQSLGALNEQGARNMRARQAAVAEEKKAQDDAKYKDDTNWGNKALAGASMGASFGGPWGALVGGIVGTVVGGAQSIDARTKRGENFGEALGNTVGWNPFLTPIGWDTSTSSVQTGGIPDLESPATAAHVSSLGKSLAPAIAKLSAGGGSGEPDIASVAGDNTLGMDKKPLVGGVDYTGGDGGTDYTAGQYLGVGQEKSGVPDGEDVDAIVGQSGMSGIGLETEEEKRRKAGGY